MTVRTDYIQIVSHVFLYSIMVFGVVGNAMVIVVIVKLKDMRNSTDIFLLNLAVADLMVLLVWGHSALLVYVDSALELPPLKNGPMCGLVSFFELTIYISSVMTILAIGFERYYAFCQPLKALYVCTKTRAYSICILTWALAALSSSPSFLLTFYKHGVIIHGAYYKSACVGRIESLSGEAYLVASASIFFFIPLIILIVVFLKIAWQLKRVQVSDVNIAASTGRRNVIVMVATVVLVFFVCHLPRRLMHLFILSPLQVQKTLGLQRTLNLTFFCEILIFLHSAVNPVLYHLMSRRFRAGFQNIFLDLGHVLRCSRCGGRCCCRKTTNTTVKPSNETSLGELMGPGNERRSPPRLPFK